MYRFIAPLSFAGIVLVAAIFGFLRDAAFCQDLFKPTTSALTHPTTEANIEFAATHHDFGRVVSGDSPSTEFSFKNAGNGTLIIEEVKGG